MTFEEELESRQYSFKDFGLLKAFAHYLKPYRKPFFLAIFIDVFINAAFTMEPVILRYLINVLTALNDGTVALDEAIGQAAFFIALDFVLMTLALIGAYFVTLQLKKIGQKVIYDLRRELFAHVLSLSTKSLKSMPIGSFVTRVTNDSQNLSLLFSDILPSFLRSFLSLLIIVCMIFVYQHFYGFIYLAYIPVVFLISYAFRKKARRYYRAEKKSVSVMNAFLSEAFSGVKVTKSFGREERMQKEFDRRNGRIYDSFIKSQNLFSVFYPFMYFLQMSCVLIVMAFGIPSTIAGTMTIGDFQMLYSYSTQFFGPIQQITQQLNTLQQIVSSAERIQGILHIEEENEKPGEEIDVPSFRGKIEFRDVSFAYVGEDYVLHHVSFTIEPGQTAAFVGPTGAGKSTIIALISRTYLPNEGTILIDDIDIRHYSLACLRRNIGIMLQDVFLFSGTVEENISLSDPEVSHEDVVKGAEEVGADSFIRRLPGGYQEKVIERGENFSAGERQLVSFARTLVYKPSLVLLDEATANIDTETEKTIQDSLERIRKIGTMVIVAHRLSTIKRADVIFVVERGEIRESGDHQSLLKRRGIYYNLYRLQNMERKLDGKGEEE